MNIKECINEHISSGKEVALLAMSLTDNKKTVSPLDFVTEKKIMRSSLNIKL